MSPLAFFDPASLSGKISGQAELYFSAGFKCLRAQRFALADDPALWFEIFVYDLGTARNAFFRIQYAAQGRVYTFRRDIVDDGQDVMAFMKYSG